MKICISFLAILFFSLTSFAQNQNFGLGVVLGDPTGLSAKLIVSNDHAIDGVLAWSPLGFHIHANYLWDNDNYFSFERQSFDLYYGIGARIISINTGDYRNKTRFGPRAPVGLNYKIRQTQLQVFVEMAVNLNLTPSSDVDLDAGIGIRFYF